jgi:hypothetical protein
MKLKDLDLAGCPKCAGISIDGRSFDVDGFEVSQELSCADCDASWTDVWTLSERMIDRDDGVDTVHFTL